MMPRNSESMVAAAGKGITVVVGFAEALSAPEVVWSLVDSGFSVVAFSRRGRRAALRHSRLVVVHEITAPESDTGAAEAELGALIAHCAAGGRNITVLPLDDASLWLCGQLPQVQGATIAGASGEQARFALDKSLQIQRAREAGFNVPESLIVPEIRALALNSIRLPAILRPAQAVTVNGTRLGKGRNWICSDATELGVALKTATGAMLVQPFITGIGEGVFGFATDSGVFAWSAHRRVRMMNPHGSGSSACVSQPVPEDAKRAAEQLVALTRWRGLFMIELLRDATGRLWFVEFNGRPWGSMALSRRLGLEYPAWAVEYACDPNFTLKVPAASARPMTCRNAGRECMHLLFVLRGPRSKAVTAWPSFWRTAVELLSVQRGDTFYNWRRDDAKVFFSDWWYTVAGNLHKSRN